MAVLRWLNATQGLIWNEWWDFSGLQEADLVTPVTPSQVLLTVPGEPVTIEFLGAEFGGLDADGFPTTGVINRARTFEQNLLVMDISGLSFDVGAFLPFVEASDEQGFLALALAGDDTVNGAAMADELYGFGGNDRVNGQAGNDELHGGEGNDTLNGGVGADRMFGGAGDDTYILDFAGDIIAELPGAGIDTVRSTVSHTLQANFENLLLLGSQRIDGTGNSAANTIFGNAAANTLVGAGGDDTITGGGAADVLTGDNGNDTLIGGLGSDVLTGGAGQDIFVFAAPLSATNRDTITDYNPAADTMHLENAHMPGIGAPGAPLTASRFYRGVAAHDANDRIIYDGITGALYYDSDGTGAAPQVLFASLSPGLALSPGDFVVI